MKVGKCKRRSVKSAPEDVRISFDHSYRRRGCGTKADRVVTNEEGRRRGCAKIEDKEEAFGLRGTAGSHSQLQAIKRD